MSGGTPGDGDEAERCPHIALHDFPHMTLGSKCRVCGVSIKELWGEAGFTDDTVKGSDSGFVIFVCMAAVLFITYSTGVI